MATIKLNDSAPKDGPVTFVFGTSEFSLEGDQEYETTNAAEISEAQRSPLLEVSVQQEAEQARIEYDPSDPHQNPKADHLTLYADPEVKAAAAERDRQIQHAAFPDDPRYAEPEKPAEPVQEQPAQPQPQPQPTSAPAPAQPQVVPVETQQTQGAVS